mgnify:CR=1 FL=1
MLLSEILHSKVVTTDLQAETKYEAIEELVDLLVEAHEIPLSLREHIVEGIFERERSMSTGMEKGIALPHGSSDRIEDIIGALGISQHDIPFESIDGKPARLVILLVLPRQNFQGHVRTLAGIAHVLSNDVLREALIAAPTPEEVIELIEEEEDKEVFDPYRA